MTAVFLGQFGPETTEALKRASAQAGIAASIYGTAAEAQDDLADAQMAPPRCIFIQAPSPDFAGFVGWLRGEARLFPVPLVFMVPGLDPIGHVLAHSLGADDSVDQASVEGVRRRLVILQEFDPEVRPPISEGIVAVAHPDLARRRVLGRTLRQAGFSLAFAADAAELAAHAGPDAPRVAIVSHRLPAPGALAAIRALRDAAKATIPAIVLATHEVGARLLRETAELPGVIVASEVAPPPDLVFLVNELLRPTLREMRGAPRLLYGALCGFRAAGDLEADYGVTYNISREGMYIRTLVPPPTGSDAWCELRPPGAGAVVHLRGRVVWRGRYGAGATPPGFGVRIAPEACPPRDLQVYLEGYDRLASTPPFKARPASVLP
jgi:DNA-binding response OmpR family regulator